MKNNPCFSSDEAELSDPTPKAVFKDPLDSQPAAPEEPTIEDCLFETKNFIRHLMIENFGRFKEIINAPDVTQREQEELMQKIAKNKRALYPPSTQSMVIN